MDAIEKFLQDIAAAGLPLPKAIITDGEIHRFATRPGEPQNGGAGWYVLHRDGGAAWGAFGCWRSGIAYSWLGKSPEDFPPEELARLRAKQEEKRKEAVRIRLADQEKAARIAAEIWENAVEDDHPYLERKGIGSASTRVARDGALLVPMRDIDGKLWNLERIFADGSKRGLQGGRRAGLVCILGDTESVETIYLAEGFSTAASVRAASGAVVACAFNAGNLPHAARALHARFPLAALVVCADDDYRTDGNIGIAKAKEAAREALGADVAVPNFGADRPEGATDFNDLHLAMGLDAVRACLDPWKTRQRTATAHAKELADAQSDDRDRVEADLVELLARDRDRPLLVGAPTGSGKTYAIAQRILSCMAQGRLAVAVANTLKAQNEIIRYLPPECRVMDLRSEKKFGPLIQGGKPAFDCIVTNHANLCSRGDAPTEWGRAFLKIDDGFKLGMDAPAILIDEADSFVAAQARSYSLGHRIYTDTDPRTGLVRSSQTSNCPRNCKNCTYSNGMSGFSTFVFDRYTLTSLRRPPEHAASASGDFLLELRSDNAEISHGWEIVRMDPEKAREAAEDFRPAVRTMGNELVPSPRGVLSAVANSPGATLRRCFPRDAQTGLEISVDQARKADKGQVVFPSKACNVWTLVGWDMEPLRRTVACARDAVLLSGSLGQDSRQLLESMGPVERVDLVMPEERKMRRILLIVVSDFDYGADAMERFAVSAPTLVFRATRAMALAMEPAVLQTGLGALFLEGSFRTPSIETDPPPLVASYMRSSIGRAVNMGSRRIVTVESDAHSGMGHVPLSRDGAIGPIEAIEIARRTLIIQAVGRVLRSDETGREDDLARVIVLVSPRLGRSKKISDDGKWLARDLQGMCEEFHMRTLIHHPARAADLAGQFLRGQELTVNDARKPRPDNRESLKTRVIELAKEGKNWREIFKKLHLERKKPELRVWLSEIYNQHK